MRLAADEGVQKLFDSVYDKLGVMDAFIAEKNNAIDARLKSLKDDYINQFWTTIEEVYSGVSYHERQGLIWSALYKKDVFLNSVSGNKQMLSQGLAEIRKMLLDGILDEKEAMSAFRDNLD